MADERLSRRQLRENGELLLRRTPPHVGAPLRPVESSSWSAGWTAFYERHPDLRPLEARDCDWSWTSLRGVDLSGTDLSGQKFVEADLTDADLRECDLSGTDLTNARVHHLKLRGADLRGASTGGVDWRQVELKGVRLDVLQAVQVARIHGALVED